MNLSRFALHGGAGVIDRKQLSATREAQYRVELERIAAAAWTSLLAGASALDVVEQAVRRLEDCPLFNAGHGAVLNRDGVAELDAAIMDGRDRSAGAVGGCFAPRYPVSLARAILKQGDHVMLVGANADRFAAAHQIECVEPDYFLTADRQHQLALALAEGRISLDHDNVQQAPDQPSPKDKTGTVGAVARDAQGNLAAATSTGGMTNKCPGRIGDAPIIGAGTWADNQTCAISATGHGEYFIRCVVAYDIHARMAYGGASLAAAADAVLTRVGDMGGTGGLIAIGGDGTVILPMNSEGMYRAWVGADGQLQVRIYREPG